MKSKKIRNFSQGFLVGAVLAALTSCNVWAPFQTNTSDEDHLEVAEKCIIQGDYTCATDNYMLITNVDLKNQKLCTAYLAQAGGTLSILLNVVTENESTMLGDLAETLLPWTAIKGAAAAQAQTYCTNAATADNGNTGVLLQALGNLFDCAMRIAKTDVYQGANDADTVCTTPGPNTGTVTPDDITTNTTTGQLNLGPGMCTQDVIQCNSDLRAITASALTESGLSNIAAALGAVPAGLTGSATAGIIRLAIRTTLAN